MKQFGCVKYDGSANIEIRSDILRVIPFVLIYLFLNIYNSNHFFFWDTVQLASKHAHFFYDNNFNFLLLPDEMDSGHIPFWGAYLALLWKFFGKSLIVSNLSVIPFIIGFIWQAYVLLRKFIRKKYLFWALALFLLDATLLAQSILPSPDVPLIFFFLLSLNAVFSNNKLLLSIGVFGLFAVSMRGMMVSVFILLIDLVLNFKVKEFRKLLPELVRKSIPYLPAFLLFLSYSLYHISEKGWIGYHENSPWAGSFERVGITGFFRNSMILSWRLIDFGRIFLWLAMLIIIVVKFKNLKSNKKALRLLFMFIAILVILSSNMLLHKNLLGHRYLLPAFLVFSLFVNYLIFEILTKHKVLIASILLGGLLSGNLWVYPEKISQGWDASLAYLPYFELQNHMDTYIKSQNIPFNAVGAEFPINTPRKYLHLSSDTVAYGNKNVNSDKYIIHSNIFNNFSDNELAKLSTDFRKIKSFRKNQIYVTVYVKREYE